MMGEPRKWDYGVSCECVNERTQQKFSNSGTLFYTVHIFVTIFSRTPSFPILPLNLFQKAFYKVQFYSENIFRNIRLYTFEYKFVNFLS
jgi:hypothetical protein